MALLRSVAGSWGIRRGVSYGVCTWSHGAHRDALNRLRVYGRFGVSGGVLDLKWNQG